jgi:glycosyltransferase involved in cell wall biosynthesis
MRIALFLQGSTTPSTRFRILQYLQRFSDAGIACTCFYPVIPKYGYVPRHLPGKQLRLLFRGITQLFIYLPHRWWQIKQARLHEYDAVILQKQLSILPVGAYLEKMISRRNKRIALDLDDAEFTNPTALNNSKSQAALLQVSDLAMHVVVCNRYLADATTNNQSKVVMLPTTVDERRYLPAQHGNSAKITIGWTGSASTLRYLRLVLPALEAVIEKTGASLLIISDQTWIDWLAHIPGIRFVKWNEQDEISQLQGIDIGIMPLPDDAWTQGKCAFKIIQYMAIGIPTVASPVGMNCETTIDGQTGYLVRTHTEWVDALCTLIESAEQRQDMGVQARRHFMQHYSSATVAAAWIELLRNLARSQP